MLWSRSLENYGKQMKKKRTTKKCAQHSLLSFVLLFAVDFQSTVVARVDYPLAFKSRSNRFMAF